MYTAIDMGVTDTAPCPIATEIVSPAYHFSCFFSRFHSVDGTRPCTSFGRSIPLLTPRPSAVAHLLILSIPTMLPTVKKYTSHDCSIAWRKSTEPWPSFLWHANERP